MMDTLLVNEMLPSIQGESSDAGWPCVFVRTACYPLRRVLCDAGSAYQEGMTMRRSDIVETAFSFQFHHVEATGGEPLAPPAIPALLRILCDRVKAVLLVTSGAIDISAVDKRVHVIMDIKCPDSGMTDEMRCENISLLKAKD